MNLDLTSLRNALAALEKSMGFLDSELAENADLREQFRAAAVQAFEFTHELAFKMLKRQLARMAADPSAIDKMAYMDVVRSGAEAGLIADVARFRDYREKRNLTSHTYNQSKAEQIEAVLNHFRDDVRFLLMSLEPLNREND
jgi:nucleotidyltransferase substrate binding protein (TIGR01987 family)